MDYLGTSEIALRWGISDRRARMLCESGRVIGARKVGRSWLIPSDAPRPVDGRRLRRESRCPELLPLFAEVDKLRERLLAMRALTTGEEERLWQGFVIENTYESNAIEGSTLSLKETSQVLEGMTIDRHPLSEHLDAYGHREALEFVKDLATRRERITGRVIREIHSLVLLARPSDRGLYRTIQVRIAGSTHRTADPAQIPELVDGLLGRWHQSPYHPLEAAAEFHLGFEAIHPFIDGNGRTGRLLLNLMLVQAGYQTINVKYADRRSYYEAFDSFEQDGLPTAMARLIAGYEREALSERLALTAPGDMP